jgi:putative membrane protein
MKKLIGSMALGIAVQFMVAGCNSNENSTATTTGTDTTVNTTTMSTDTSMNNMQTDTSKMASQRMNSGGTTGSQNEFVSKAAMGGMMEVELGKLAQANAASNDVKEFGKMMETDHTKANDELKSVAASNNIMVPGSMDEKMTKEMNELSGKKGADFDKAYVNMMVDDHVKDIAEFKKAAASNSNADVKKFATNTLPTLQKHLDKIKSIKSKM